MTTTPPTRTTYSITCAAFHPECTDGTCGWCDDGCDACECVCTRCGGALHINHPSMRDGDCSCTTPTTPIHAEEYADLMDIRAARH